VRKEVNGMQVKVRRLREVLDLLKPAVPRKTALPVLVNVLLKDGKAIATDLESAVIIDLPEAQEACLLPLHGAIQLLKYIPGNEDITLERKRGWLNLTWPGGSASYESPDPKDYPPIPEFEPQVQGDLDGDAFLSALTSVVGYCSTEDSRPVLNGVTTFLGETLEFMGADGYRLAYQTLAAAFPGKERVIIPARAIPLLEHLWRKTAKPAQVAAEASLVEIITAKRLLNLALDSALGNGSLRLSFGEVTMLTKPIQGEPPDFKKVMELQEAPVTQAAVFAPEFERAVRRIKQVAEKGQDTARLILNDDSITITAKNDEQQAEATVPTVTTMGTPNRIGVNASYLLEYLQGKDGIVTIELRSGTAPLSLRHKSSPLVLIMPMSVQWDDEKPPSAKKTEPEPSVEEPAEAEQETGEQEPVTESGKPAKRKRKR
jgi:DNA polymerase III sliding clamp (beta) subunit (PCNA family)